MTTVAEMISNVYDLTLGGRSGGSINLLSGALASNATTLTCTYPVTNSVRFGDVIEIDDERMLVLNVASPVLTVRRGHEATTAVAHADASVITVQPPIFQGAVRTAIRNAIQGLPPKLYNVDSYDVTTVSGQSWYELDGAIDDSSVLHCVGVYISAESGNTDAGWNRVDARFVRNLPSDGLGRLGVKLTQGSFGSGRTLRVQVATRFLTSDLSDTAVASDIGLDDAWIDIVVWRAAATLIGPLEAQRAVADRLGGVDGKQVQPGQRANSASLLRKWADDRLRNEALALAARYPYWSQQ